MAWSVSSRSFRRIVLYDSIMSVFGGSNSREPPKPAVTAERKKKPSDSSDQTIISAVLVADPFAEKAIESKVEETSPPLTGRDVERGSSGTGPKEGELDSYNEKLDPFAGVHEGGVDYKSMAWWQAGMVMIAETISLGILSLPAALSVLGLIPGLLILVILGILASYTGFVIGQFKIRYPHVHSMADAGDILFGRVGREVLGIGQLLFFILIMGSHILTFAIMMSAITDHTTCSIVFMVAGMAISLIFTLPRTLKNLSYYSIASFVSIIAAVGITMISVSITKPGQVLSQSSHTYFQDVNMFPAPGTEFHTAFLAVANMVFAYAGHVAFFSFISELREPKDFPKALALLQVSDVSMYIISSVVIYYYAGSHVASPALDSTPPLIRKIAYGVAIPTIVIAGVVNGHVAVKYLYVRLLRDSKENVMHQRSIKAWAYWVGICAALWVLAWVIAEGVPVFNDLLGLTSALFASWYTFGLSGMMWMHLNLTRRRKSKTGELVQRFLFPQMKGGWTWKRGVLFSVNVLNVLIGAAICVIGLYATALSIKGHSVTKKPFSC